MAKKRRSEAAQRMTESSGADRSVYFANGGDLAGWRGRATRFTDRAKQASKKACRDRKSWDD